MTLIMAHKCNVVLKRYIIISLKKICRLNNKYLNSCISVLLRAQ